MTNETQHTTATPMSSALAVIPLMFRDVVSAGGDAAKSIGAKMLKRLTAAGLSPLEMGIERHLSKLDLARKVPGEGRSKVWQFGPERAQRGGKRLGGAAAGKVSRAKKSAPGRTRPPTPAAMKQAHRAAKDALRGKRPGYEGA